MLFGRRPGNVAALIDAASAPYWSTDLFAYYRARGKLRGDPAFTQILKEGLLLGAQRILDLGCGQGLLAAWLLAARSRNDEGPHNWTVMLTHYRRTPRVYCRSGREWQEVLAAGGFDTAAVPMSAGTPFANIMLIARPRKRVRPPREMPDSMIAQ